MSERIADAARQLHDQHDSPDRTCQLAVDLAERNIERCDGAGLSFVRSRNLVETVAATSQMVVDADRLQYCLREGPSLDAIRAERTVFSPGIEHDARWPTWGPRAAEETGAQSVLAFQLFTHGDTLGALTLYSHSRDAFDDDACEEGMAIAAHVAIAIASAQQIHQLSSGLDTRTVIGQATGLLMERFDLDATRAFSVLARLSSQQNTKLRTVASEVVANRQARDLNFVENKASTGE